MAARASVCLANPRANKTPTSSNISTCQQTFSKEQIVIRTAMNLFTAHCKLAIKTRNYLSLGWQAFFCCGSPFFPLSSWPGTRKAAFSRQRKPMMRSIGLECSLLPASSVARTRAARRPPVAHRLFRETPGKPPGRPTAGGRKAGDAPAPRRAALSAWVGDAGKALRCASVPKNHPGVLAW